jgi:ABC-2 type transport system ATP-binding protein
VPTALARHDLILSPGGGELTYTYDSKGERSQIPSLLADLGRAGIKFHDLNTAESSLEDIFVSLVRPQR